MDVNDLVQGLREAHGEALEGVPVELVGEVAELTMRELQGIVEAMEFAIAKRDRDELGVAIEGLAPFAAALAAQRVFELVDRIHLIHQGTA